MIEKAGGTKRNKSASDRDWTKGSIVGNLLLLSWPMMIMESSWVAGQILDMVWVGRLGPAS